MTTQTTTPEGATLHLGGDAYAHPSLTDRLVPLDSITPYPGNPRRGDQDAITASIRDHGLYAGVVVQQSTGHILVGNHRRHGLTALGATRIPVDYLDVDDTRAAAIVARDNRTADTGSYDDPELLELLTFLDNAGVPPALMGYADDDLMVLRRRVEAEDVFTVGTGHMLDEFRDISGQDAGTDYAARFTHKVVVYLRDDEAVTDFCKRLRIKDALGADLNYPLGWDRNA